MRFISGGESRSVIMNKELNYKAEGAEVKIKTFARPGNNPQLIA
jgi:hypothetical protein